MSCRIVSRSLSAKRVRHAGSVAVQEQSAVTVDDSLGIARGRGGVAHGGRRVFIELRPRIRFVRRRGEQRFVVEDVTRFVHDIVQHDDLADRFQLAADGFENGKQRGVDEDDAVLGVVDDVRQLLRSEAQVESVQHAAGAGNRKIQFQMARAVPAQRPDAISGLRLPGSGARARGDEHAGGNRDMCSGASSRPARGWRFPGADRSWRSAPGCA